ncbi:hypothetical protein B0H67DRAFT_561454 [Lasiosphaeris hirsuta]|uniref:Uncharacterized protein n=1 Tax=Lasiosphaeris hirsuta TaxID=260670 RepID=A0AA40BA05_9PEZI|nr:hypothetical protein B0H67DRAFT_561454 [Lasiosphaeris hirsuta]
MHINKVSAIVAQVGLTAASVVGGEEMGRRQDWKQAKAEALEVASAAAAQHAARADAAVTAAPTAAADPDASAWEKQRSAALDMVADAVSRAQQLAAGYRAQFGESGNGRSNTSNKKRDGAELIPPPPAPAPAPAVTPVAVGQHGDWQNDAASAQSLASSYQVYGSSLGASWASYGASVASDWNGGNGNGDWQTAAASAESLASSYRSEYGSDWASATPSAASPVAATPAAETGVGKPAETPVATPAETGAGGAAPTDGAASIGGAGVVGGSTGTIKAGASATKSPGVVQVNGAADNRAKALGAGVAALAVAVGML